MSDAFWNSVRRASQEEASSRATTRQGTITSYDPARHAVKVAIQPDGTLTGWIPLKVLWIGNGWGMFAAPAIGTVVEVDYQEADAGVGSAGWRFANLVSQPLPVPSGEFWLVHKQGASIKLTNDGALTLDTGAGASLQLKEGNITSAGDWTHTGTITASDDIVADGISLHDHTHSGVQSGSDSTGAPQ